MAQLPPKIPTMATAWPEFGGGHHHHAAHGHHHQRSPSMGAFLAAPLPPFPLPPPAPANGGAQQQQQQQQPSWVDEFLDFSAAKRGAHRRSVSDSVAFLDPVSDDNAGVGAHDFDRLDDDQLMSMFSDDLQPPPPQQQPAAAAASASSPSDHNSMNDEKQDKGETDEAQSECDGATPGQPASPATVDPKRVKRYYNSGNAQLANAEFPNFPSSFLAIPSTAGSWRTGSPRSGRACGSCSTSRSWSAASRRSRCVPNYAFRARNFAEHRMRARAVNLTSNRLLFFSFSRADGGVGVVTARRVPRPPALAADAGQQPPQAAHRRPRAGQDLQRW